MFHPACHADLSKIALDVLSVHVRTVSSEHPIEAVIESGLTAPIAEHAAGALLDILIPWACAAEPHAGPANIRIGRIKDSATLFVQCDHKLQGATRSATRGRPDGLPLLDAACKRWPELDTAAQLVQSLPGRLWIEPTASKGLRACFVLPPGQVLPAF